MRGLGDPSPEQIERGAGGVRAGVSVLVDVAFANRAFVYGAGGVDQVLFEPFPLRPGVLLELGTP